MLHYKRNIRFILFLIIPILSFLLGWSLNQQQHKDLSLGLGQQKEEIKKDNIFSAIKIHRKSDPKDISLSTFWEAWNVLEENFLYKDRFSDKEQLQGAIKGLVNSVADPYTVFMSAEETSEFEKSMSDEVFEGIGAEIAVKKGQLTIVSPLKGSPAELAGIKAGDKIFSIDGEPSLKMTAEEAVTIIRGPKGEGIILEILRENEPKPIKITIVRDSIINKSLTWEMIDEIAVLEINQFGEELDNLFLEAVPNILLEKPEAIIVDLRNNGGGLLDTSIEIMNEFFDKKILVKTKGRKIGQTGDLESDNGGAFLDIPVVVLVNKGTASASEIFAGAFQDYNRGIIIGEQTFGKGVVQNIIPLSGGATMKVTVAEWLTPKGRSIHEKGISPDIEAIRTIDDYDNNIDPVLDKAFNILNTDGEYEKVLSEKNDKKEEIIENENKDENIEEVSRNSEKSISGEKSDEQ
jgi:carboxyl-terminal processing protease